MKTTSKPIFVSEKRGLYFDPKKLINLWDMLQVCALEVWAVYFSLDSERQAIQSRIHKHGVGHLITPEDREFFVKLAPKIECTMTGLKMDKSASRWNHLQVQLIAERCLATVIAGEVSGLLVQMMDEARERYFAFIPPERIMLFEKEALFGGLVNQQFPSARDEIKDLGNCLAMGLHTAAVFHAMRTAEWGLRALAAHLKVPLKKQPLEYADWGAIIQRIERKLAILQGKARGRKKSEALEFYRRTLSECNMLKDVWRNNVMHTRGRYNESEALGVYLRVQEFMQRLAARISEVN